MKVRVLRIKSTKTDTIGALFIDGEFICYTLEDGYKSHKIAGETRIPAGEYKLKPRSWGGHYLKYTAKFKSPHPMIQLENVPQFQFILIHIGNSHKDSKGCLLVGDRFKYFKDTDTHFIYNSTKTYKKLWDILIPEVKKRNVTLRIYDLDREV